jgi:hypothetical protein
MVRSEPEPEPGWLLAASSESESESESEQEPEPEWLDAADIECFPKVATMKLTLSTYQTEVR